MLWRLLTWIASGWWKYYVTGWHSTSPPLANFRFSNVTFIACDWPWWEYLQHRNWQMLQSVLCFVFIPRPSFPFSVPHKPVYIRDLTDLRPYNFLRKDLKTEIPRDG